MNPIRHNNPTTHCRKNQAAGFSLIELLTALMLLGIVTAMIYSVFTGFNRYASTQRKTVKTELDLVNVYWPMTKEIESAGFGLASSGTSTCVQSNALSVSGTEVRIHSTATGDKTLSGAWGYVSGATCSTGITAAAEPDNNVLLLGSLDKKYVRKTTVNTSGNLANCTTDDSGRIVYWIPSASNLECYETRYSLRDYTTDDPAPKTCAPGTLKLSRSAQSTTTSNYQPMLDCVRDLDYRLGCIDTNGNLTWQQPPLSNPLTDCGTAKLRLIKVGLVVQSSEKLTTQVPADITMFEDLTPTTLRKTITLSTDQRYYRWKKREQTITLRNLE